MHSPWLLWPFSQFSVLKLFDCGAPKVRALQGKRRGRAYLYRPNARQYFTGGAVPRPLLGTKHRLTYRSTIYIIEVGRAASDTLGRFWSKAKGRRFSPRLPFAISNCRSFSRKAPAARTRAIVTCGGYPPERAGDRAARSGIATRPARMPARNKSYCRTPGIRGCP